jgi:predicted ATPase/class 3 adenylate cyclase/DNA-binding CsgD family transcriptional regulator
MTEVPKAIAGRALPIGTVTFLLTDIEASTSLWSEDPATMAVAVARHYEMLDSVIAFHGGIRPEEQGEGDSVVGAFSRASDALRAALDAQLAVASEPWPTPRPVRVRMAVHTGEARLRNGSNYTGLAIVRTARLRSLGHGGQVLVSSASRDVALDQLADGIELIDLGMFRLKDLARPEHVYQLTHSALPSEFPALRSLDAVPNNLPVRLSVFIGREHELTAVAELVASHRLVTIIGAGGGGKTRVALQSASEETEHFPDGLWWVELAPLQVASDVSTIVAASIGAPLTESIPHVDAIASRIGDGRALLVLDNCEHVIEAAAKLADVLLQRCPNLQILATSRSPLDVPGETTWRVPPLSAPTLDKSESGMSIEQLSQFDSVRLFIERARTARPTFALNNDNAPAVAEICHRLNGIPLAIELAAARAKSLLPSQILEGLDDSLRMLSGGSRLLLPRQQTLEASIRWSTALLGDPEQALLHRLCVFAGSFDLRGAEAVCAGDGLNEIDVLDALERLIDQSLVAPWDENGSGRFLMLETVRQYGARQLMSDESVDRWRSRHAAYYAHLAKKVSPLCETVEQSRAVAGLDAEHDNIRAALHHLLAQGDGEALAEMTLALGPFWDIGGDKIEGVTWTTRSLNLLPERPTATRARLTAFRGECRMSLGDLTTATLDAQHALDMGTEVGDIIAQGRSSSTLTTMLGYDNLEEWRVRWEETIRLLTEADDTYALAGTLTWGGVPLLRRGYTRDALVAFERSRPVVLASGSPVLLASQRLWDGFAANRDGRPREGERLARLAQSGGVLGSVARVAAAEWTIGESLLQRGVNRPSWQEYAAKAERARRAGEYLAYSTYISLAAEESVAEDPKAGVTMIDTWLTRRPETPPLLRCRGLALAAEATFALGDHDGTLRRCVSVREASNRCEDVLFAARALVLIGHVELQRSRVGVAEQLARDAIASHALHGNRVEFCGAVELLTCVAEARGDTLDAARLFGATSARRRIMESPIRVPFAPIVADTIARIRTKLGSAPFAEACESGSTLNDDDLLAFIDRTHGSRGRPSLGWESLTPTELQVAGLVRDGLSNRDIAKRLLMGTETVKTHVSHIFIKLDVSKRTQLAAIAIRIDETSVES